MLRPATPLSVLLLIAFCLLLLSVLSTPVIKAIPLSNYQGVNFGVFGYCNGDTCSKIEIGYDTSTIFNSDTNANGDYDLPSATRTTLSAILVVHPIAALLTLVMFVLAITAHFHSPSHSSRYLLVVLILSIVNFLACLLAFLVDVLLFVPNLAWGSYLVLAATILVALSGLVSCAMRRTVVSRKARKKRIAENAEMSGENFYNRQAQEATALPVATTLQPTVPSVSGANGGADKLPEFASFEKKDDHSSDERVPLTARSPSNRSPNTMANEIATSPTDMPYSGPIGPRRSASNSTLPRDQYGNPIQPQDGYGPRSGPSVERMRSRGGMSPGGYRGRGGYPGPGRGGYNGYGSPPPNGRVGYGPPGRGGYGPPGGRGGYGPPQGRGGYGPPPRPYGPAMRGGRPPPPSYQGGPGPYERRGSPGGPYGAGPYDARQPSPGPSSGVGYSTNPSMPSISNESYEAYNPDRVSLPRAESPPPLPGVDSGVPGQAVEMDATTGSPSHPPNGFGQFGIRESDADIAGMLAMQQGRMPSPGRRHDTYMSDMSRYSQEEGAGAYVPPRQAWTQGSGRNSPRMPSPLNVPGRELTPNRGSPAPQAPAGEYYEDVDPRFSEPPPPPEVQRPTPPPIQTTNTYETEDTPQGARSPAESEQSNFTSISQRGINPSWDPPPPPLPPMRGGYGGAVVPRRPVNRPTDLLLSSNPDFELPSRGSPPRAGGGMVPPSAYPGVQ